MPSPRVALRLIIIGAGRAGGSLALAAGAAGHEIVGVLSRSTSQSYGPELSWDTPFPEADLVLIAVRDEAIPEVVERLETVVASVGVVAHLSGFVPVRVLHPLQERGVSVGGFHPLQSMPDPVSGARALEGAYVAIDGDALALDVLTHLAESLGMHPFPIRDEERPAYHAAAAAASNFVVTALAVAEDLFRSAGVDPAVARPLVERVIANVYEQGAASALTGPIARGDLETVLGHLEAARQVSKTVGEQFRLMAEATTRRAGREEDLELWR
ncbi:MAG: Rossmann-like and DUF2520 domain-containing protein [Acidimicrobiia bacterium]